MNVYIYIFFFHQFSFIRQGLPHPLAIFFVTEYQEFQEVPKLRDISSTMHGWVTRGWLMAYSNGSVTARDIGSFILQHETETSHSHSHRHSHSPFSHFNGGQTIHI